MDRIAEQLDEKLRTLDPASAQQLESLVREALDKADQDKADQDKLCNSTSGWPEGYFQKTAGVLAGEDFERPPQGELPRRDEW